MTTTTTGGSPASTFSTRALHAEIKKRDHLRAYSSNPLLLGREVFPHHFRLPTSARWHTQAISMMIGARVEEFDFGSDPSLP